MADMEHWDGRLENSRQELIKAKENYATAKASKDQKEIAEAKLRLDTAFDRRNRTKQEYLTALANQPKA